MQVEAETALCLAAAAAQHGLELLDQPAEANAGIGLVMDAAETAPSGAARCFVAAQTSSRTQLYSAAIRPGKTAPLSADQVAAELLVGAAADVCPAIATDRSPHVDDALVTVVKEQAPELLASVWTGATPIAWSLPDGSLRGSIDKPPAGILSGSFNPLHEGHRALKDAAEKWLNGPVHYELSLRNADKPPLDYLTIARRVRQFSSHPVALTSAATFAEKSNILPDTTFVVGLDTALRIVDPRFYGNREDWRFAELGRIRRAGCRFLVAARKMGEGVLTLGDLDLPDGLIDLFEELPVERFRLDVSSSERRELRAP